MAFRFRKSLRIAPGVRLNLSAKSASVRVGPKGLGYTVSTTGKKRLSASIPGTGLSYSKEVSSKPQLTPSASSLPAASQSDPPSKGVIVVLLLAIGAGLVWCSVPSNDIAGEHSETNGSVQSASNPATGRPPRHGSPTAEAGSSVQTTLYSTANVRLRTSPSARSQTVLTVPVGSAVLSSKREGQWHYVSYGSYSGWILGDYLAKPPPQSATTISPIKPPVSSTQADPDGRTISGRAAVVDGDTINVSGTRVRFNGVDAPESAQLCQNVTGKNYRCGQTAAKALDAWLAKSRPVTCTLVEWDRYGRFVGDCYRADGAAVAAWLVGAGHAMDWPQYSNGAYASYQDEARAARRGIWQGKVQPPWEWRAVQQAPKPEVSNPPARLHSGSCDIKGNISKKGERIYHVPGQRFYNDTVITATRGERMFCSEEEARQAGWRRARG